MQEYLSVLRVLIVTLSKRTMQTGRSEPAFLWAKFMLRNNTLEQRKYKRIELPKAIVLNPGNACVLVNISRGGLLFKSLSLVAWPEKWALDTITIKSEFDIQNCPVELVWMRTDDELIGSSMMLANVGVKFGDLDQSQEAKLDSLLSHYYI